MEKVPAPPPRCGFLRAHSANDLRSTFGSILKQKVPNTPSVSMTSVIQDIGKK